MKSVLKVISWTLFFMALMAVFTAFICTAGGVIAFVLALCNNAFAYIFAYLAIGYYVSIVVIVLFCIIFSTYEWIMKAREDKNAVHNDIS